MVSGGVAQPLRCSTWSSAKQPALPARSWTSPRSRGPQWNPHDLACVCVPRPPRPSPEGHVLHRLLCAMVGYSVQRPLARGTILWKCLGSSVVMFGRPACGPFLEAAREAHRRDTGADWCITTLTLSWGRACGPGAPEGRGVPRPVRTSSRKASSRKG